MIISEKFAFARRKKTPAIFSPKFQFSIKNKKNNLDKIINTGNDPGRIKKQPKNPQPMKRTTPTTTPWFAAGFLLVALIGFLPGTSHSAVLITPFGTGTATDSGEFDQFHG